MPKSQEREKGKLIKGQCREEKGQFYQDSKRDRLQRENSGEERMSQRMGSQKSEQIASVSLRPSRAI